MKRKITFCLIAMGLWAAVGLALGVDRFSYSYDGLEVTDNMTGLVWQRCPVGFQFSVAGTSCNSTSGDTTKFTHDEALRFAQSQDGWRLPNIKELFSIVDLNRKTPAIDPGAFPNTPSTYFWSSSPNVTVTSLALAVYFYDGGVYNAILRNNSYYVRLVR